MHQQWNPQSGLDQQTGSSPTNSNGKVVQDRISDLKKKFDWPKTFNRQFSSIADLSLGELLGKGGFSEVYKATSKIDSKFYAVKKVVLSNAG